MKSSEILPQIYYNILFNATFPLIIFVLFNSSTRKKAHFVLQLWWNNHKVNR